MMAAAEGGSGIKSQADSVPLPLSKGMQLALGDLLGALLDTLKEQESISSRKFEDGDSKEADKVVTLKGVEACWGPKGRDESTPVTLKHWGAPLEALFKDDFGAVKTMALFNAIKLADGAYGQFSAIVDGTWEGMPPNIKGFIPRLLRIVGALKLLEQHYTTLADRSQLTKEEVMTMFTELDTNGDGVISVEEWQQYIQQGGMSASRQEALERIFTELDKDRSGTLSADEFENQTEYSDFLRDAYAVAKAKVGILNLRLAGLMFLLVKREGAVPLKGKERAYLEATLPDLGVDVTESMNYKELANALDNTARGTSWAETLDGGAKDFAAYFTLRNSNKKDLKAFEESCYGQAVTKQLDAVLKNKGKPGKDALVLAELQALSALPY